MKTGKISPGILKLLAEGLMILLSVLLAFYFENLRQERASRMQLIADLKELKESIEDDTLVLGNIAQHFIPSTDTLYQETLALIDERTEVHLILQQVWGIEALNYNNWTVKRMLDSDALAKLDRSFRNEIWEYNRWLNELLDGTTRKIDANNEQLRDLMFSGLTYKNDFSKIAPLSKDMPLIRYREYSDSSVVYSPSVKSLIIHNLTILGAFQFQVQWHREKAEVAIGMIEKKIGELE